MEQLESIERQQEEELKQFESYGNVIQTECASFWDKFNDYEKQLSINENSRA
jgi:uncharacterized protein involved in exopolysaccharide biosynthesis